MTTLQDLKRLNSCPGDVTDVILSQFYAVLVVVYPGILSLNVYFASESAL